MTDEAVKSPETPAPAYAGFWLRLFALILDMMIVSVALFPLVVFIGTVAPENIEVKVPFGLFTTERVIETSSAEKKNDNGSTTVIETRLVEVVRLGKWRYLYLDTTEHSGDEKETSRQLIDAETREPMTRTSTDNLEMLVLLIYLSLMESSRRQASLGKMMLRLRVTDDKGQRLGVVQSFGRNLLKIVSAITLFIGFMMAGWTARKQALHDKLAGCLVVRQG